MLKFTIEQKHCKCLRVIIGENVAQAYKNNNINASLWLIIDIEEI